MKFLKGLPRTCGVLLLVVSLLGQTVFAVEQSEEFLASLRGQRLHALALDYLDRMESSPLADDAFKRKILFHRGVTRIDQSRQAASFDERAQLLDQAQAALDQFAKANQDTVEGAEARSQLANVLVERGKQNLARAEKLPEGASSKSEREKLRLQSRSWLEDAHGKFQEIEAYYSGELKKFPKTLDPRKERDKIAQRQDYRGRLAQSRILAAQTQYEKAKTYGAKEPEFLKLNQEASGKLGKLFNKYSRWLVGFYALLYEGRCHQAIGEYQMAIGCYEDILIQPDTHPAFRQLITKATRYRAECYLAQDQYEPVIVQADAWLKKARGSEEKRPEWLAVRFRLAEAYQGQAGLQKEGTGVRRKFLNKARDAFRAVSRSPGEFQKASRAAFSALGRGRERAAQPKNFLAAYEAGKEAISSMNAARIGLQAAKKNNPAAVPELQAQLGTGKADARQFFQLAMTLVNDKSSLQRLNETRYFLCWLSWENEDYYQAAVLGAFLARRYPDHASAPAAAKIAMASFERLYSQTVLANRKAGTQADSETGNAEFEAGQMARMAQFITRRWPGTEDASNAFRVLVGFSLRNNRIEQAKELVQQVPAAVRWESELQLGNALWNHYLELSRDTGANPSEQEVRSQQKKDALELLERGMAEARKRGQISETIATSGLYWVQALLSEGKYQPAIDLLEDKKIGPMTLVAKSDPSAARPQYMREVYKAALRAYVSVVPPQSKKAMETMEALEGAVRKNGGGSAEQLTRIYIGLGQGLRQQIEQLQAAGQDAEAARVREAFIQFLDRIHEQQTGGNWAHQVWIAQTYFNMGEAVSKKSAPSATKYFTKAHEVYQQMLAAAASDAQFAPSPASLLAVKKQLGECQRQLGQYKESLDTFSSILKEKETRLGVQIAAAYAYQQWGEEKGSQWLEKAIFGGYKLRSTGKNRVWGWLRLAKVLERASRTNPKYRDLFFEARVNAARCRYLVGLQSKGATRKKNLSKAKQSIRSMVRLFPDLGGDRWKAQFEQLLKEIQNTEGQRPVGLKEFAVAGKR